MVRALVSHQFGQGSGLAMYAIYGLDLVSFANAPMNRLN